MPDIIGLVVIAMNCNEQPFCRQLQPFRDKLPGPDNCFTLEVVAEKLPNISK